MARNKKIGIGCEIECILNKDKINFLRFGSYHSGVTLLDKDKNKHEEWEVQNDSSISAGEKFKNYKQAEIVSRCFKSKKAFFDGLDLFVEVFSCNGKYELNEVMEINESCGCHIHISQGKKTFRDRLHSTHYEQMRKDFFKRINKSSLPDSIKQGVKEQYDRTFSKVLTDKGLKREREKPNGRPEFNFRSEEQGRGLEWRSFNLNKVTTWKQLKILMGIAFCSIEDLLGQKKEWKKGNLFRVEMDKKKAPEIKSIEYKIRKHENKIDSVQLITKPNEIHLIELKNNLSKDITKQKNSEIMVKKQLNKLLEDITTR